MYTDFHLTKDRPAYLQIKEYLRRLISTGMLREGQKLPSTRELSCILRVSRNTVLEAYRCLIDEGFAGASGGRGTYITAKTAQADGRSVICTIKWPELITGEARKAEELDIVKHRLPYKKGMIAFTSIAPDEKLFDLEGFKRAFLNRFAAEGETILSYGYAQGYRPLMRYLMQYMLSKGLDIEGRDILITNGFTEGFDLTLSALCSGGQKVVCENPTHNTALKIMRLHGLEPIGVEMDRDGMNPDALEKALREQDIRLAYLIPSYHNPTGMVTTPERRAELLSLLCRYRLPVIEDGFNEELRYSGSHIAPLIACGGKSNNVVYIGSFSKILFPGLRIGWIVADKELISYIESLKRSRNIHTSVFDQAILYQYFHEGNFEKYIKKARKIYREKYETAVQSAKEHIPCESITGEGGLHIFIKLRDGIDARKVLAECYKKGVIFMPGDVFYTDNTGVSTMRIGFSRVETEDIKKGIQIIGEAVRKYEADGTESD